MKKNYKGLFCCHGKSILKVLVMSVFLQLIFAATFPHNAFGQTRNITFNKDQATVKEVLDVIKKQTNLSVVYDVDDVDLSRAVDLHVNNSDVNLVLSKLFAGTNVNYVVNDTHIVLTVATRPIGASSQTPNTVKGKVTDTFGTPLIGVTVLVKGTSKGTTTSHDGTYMIQALIGNTLQFSYLGYSNKEYKITSSSTIINVSLEEASTEVDQVVVTALGIKRAEKALSYNVQQIASDEITAVKDPNFMNTLSGKIAGVQINSGAGGPGSASKVVIRGVKSLTKDNNALYVIDGIPMFDIDLGGGDGMMTIQTGTSSIADINPDDIESVNVLTGPTAAALYGSEAANGVVIINTKKGTANKTSVVVSNSTMFSAPFIMPEMQNRYGNPTGDFASWGDKTDRRFNPRKFFKTGTNISNSVTLSTGSEKNQTYFSVASNNSNGILPNNEYDRYNFTFRNTTNFFHDKMMLDVGGSYIIQHDKNMVSQGQYFNPLPSLYLFPRADDFSEIQLYQRYEPVNDIFLQYWPYGNQGKSLQNPYWIMNRMNRENHKKRYMFNATLQYKIFDWLDVTGRARLDNTHMDITEKFYASTDPNFASEKGYYTMIKRDDRQFYGDILINVNKNITPDIHLSANVGTSIKDLRMDLVGQKGNLYQKYNLFTIQNLSPINYKPKQDGYIEQVQSIFANLELSYKGMLYLTATARNDWDSRLAFTKYSSFFYPSVGMSVIFSEIFEMPEWITFLKLRGGYSSVGAAYERFLSNPYFDYDEVAHTWETLRRYPNADLKPEITRSYEIGLNARFLKNVLKLDVSYYKSNTRHQTFMAKLSPTSGFKEVPVQAGNIQNSGVEISLTFDKTWRDFSWSSRYTFTHNKNKIINLADGVKNPVTGEPIQMPELRQTILGSQGSPEVVLKKGGSIGDIYYSRELKRDGNGNLWVNSKTYEMEIEDIDERKAGSLLPKCQMGWSNSFAWKGVNMSFLINARIGGVVVSNTEAILDYYGVSKRSAKARDNGGVNINNGKVDAKMYYQLIGQGTGVGPYYIYDATNVRLQELSIGYDMPSKWFGDLFSVNVSLVGRNLWMIYNKAPFDPELAPTTKTFYQGVDYFMQPSLRNIGFSLKFKF